MVRWAHNLGVERHKGGGDNEKWAKSGPRSYMTPTASGVPNAIEHGGIIRSAGWLHNPRPL